MLIQFKESKQQINNDVSVADLLQSILRTESPLTGIKSISGQ